VADDSGERKGSWVVPIFTKSPPAQTREPRLVVVQGRARSRTEAETVGTWAQDALKSLARLPGVHRVGLAMVEGGGRRLRFTASDRDGSEGSAWCHVDAYDDVPLNTAVRTGQPVTGSLHDLRRRYPRFVSRQRGTPTVALAAIPIVTAGQVLGGFVLFYDAPQPFDCDQRRELEQLGVDLGATLRHVQRGQERAPASLPDEPVPPGAVTAVHEVENSPSSVSMARRFLRQTLDDWRVDQDASDTAVLCLSELVTNSVVHTNGGCVVRVVLDGRLLTVAVRDQGAEQAVSPTSADDPLRVHGRGLQLVDALAARWGSELDLEGTTVWFTLELDRAPGG
jgi:anti-sigma regulatory factor (Ser/Thr protein kinase)